jgi:hypothetical protein
MKCFMLGTLLLSTTLPPDLTGQLQNPVAFVPDFLLACKSISAGVMSPLALLRTEGEAV